MAVGNDMSFVHLMSFVNVISVNFFRLLCPALCSPASSMIELNDVNSSFKIVSLFACWRGYALAGSSDQFGGDRPV